MKVSFNILRPLIFLFCGLGYLPLQSADNSSISREIASVERPVEVQKEASQNSKEKAPSLQTANNKN